MEKNILARDLAPGMLLVCSGKRTFNATVDSVDSVPPGTRVTGPRGGKYALTAHGASVLLLVVAGSQRPMLGKNTTVTVFVNEEY